MFRSIYRLLCGSLLVATVIAVTGSGARSDELLSKLAGYSIRVSISYELTLAREQRPVAVSRNFTLYVSTAGRLFLRDEGRNSNDQTIRNLTVVVPGERRHNPKTNTSSGWLVEGETLTRFFDMTTTRQSFRINVRSDRTSWACTVRVDYRNLVDGKRLETRSWRTGKPVEFLSFRQTGSSCRVTRGNLLATEN